MNCECPSADVLAGVSAGQALGFIGALFFIIPLCAGLGFGLAYAILDWIDRRQESFELVKRGWKK
jgi:hypothetical protein